MVLFYFLFFSFPAEREPKNSGSKGKCKTLNSEYLKKCRVVGPPVSYDYPVHPFFLTSSRRVVNHKHHMQHYHYSHLTF